MFHSYIRTYILNIQVYIVHTYAQIHRYTRICINNTLLHTYIHKLIHTYVRTYIYTHIWPISKHELITKHLKSFMKFTNSIDYDKL